MSVWSLKHIITHRGVNLGEKAQHHTSHLIMNLANEHTLSDLSTMLFVLNRFIIEEKDVKDCTGADFLL